MPLLLLSKLAFKYRDALWALALMFALGLIQREHDAKVACQALIEAKPLVTTAAVVDVKKGPSRVKETERRFKRPAPAVTTAKLEGALVSCPEVDVVEIERDIYTGPEETHSSNTRAEIPMAMRLEHYRRYYVGVSVPAGNLKEVAPRAGLSFAGGAFDVGLAFDPWVNGKPDFKRKALRLETAYRF